MNVGDDVTINGVIIDIKHAKGLDIDLVYIRLNSGIEVAVIERDINTVRPKIEIPEKDERRGN